MSQESNTTNNLLTKIEDDKPVIDSLIGFAQDMKNVLGVIEIVPGDGPSPGGKLVGAVVRILAGDDNNGYIVVVQVPESAEFMEDESIDAAFLASIYAPIRDGGLVPDDFPKDEPAAESYIAEMSKDDLETLEMLFEGVAPIVRFPGMVPRWNTESIIRVMVPAMAGFTPIIRWMMGLGWEIENIPEEHAKTLFNLTRKEEFDA